MHKGNVSQLLIGILMLSAFTLNFAPQQQNNSTSKLLIEVDTNNDFTGTLTLAINEKIANSTVYYFLLPFIANNFRANNPLVEVSNKSREGMTFVFIIITPSTPLPNLQIDFDIEPLYKEAKDFYIQELDRRPNFMLVRLADDNENQNTLYLRYNITDIKNSYKPLASFTDKMLYPNEIEIRFPNERTRFSGMGDATNIEDKDNKHLGTREDYTFIAPIEFFSTTYLWINYSFTSPLPAPSTLLAILVGVISTFSMATFSIPEEFLTKKIRMILATSGAGIATVLIVLGFYNYGFAYLLRNLTELLLALPIYVICMIIVGYNLFPIFAEKIRNRKK